MIGVDQIISRMILAVHASNMAEMLRIAGLSTAAGSTWRKRNNVPDGSVAKVAKISSVSFEWLKTGEGEMLAKGSGKTAGQIDPAMAQDIVKQLKAKCADKAIELTGEELMAVQMLRDLSDHDRQRVMHTLQMAWTAGKVE